MCIIIGELTSIHRPLSYPFRSLQDTNNTFILFKEKNREIFTNLRFIIPISPSLQAENRNIYLGISFVYGLFVRICSVYVSNDDKQYYHCYKSKLLVEKFGHCFFNPTNQDLIKVPKVLKPTNKRAIS